MYEGNRSRRINLSEKIPLPYTGDYVLATLRHYVKKNRYTSGRKKFQYFNKSLFPKWFKQIGFTLTTLPCPLERFEAYRKENRARKRAYKKENLFLYVELKNLVISVKDKLVYGRYWILDDGYCDVNANSCFIIFTYFLSISTKINKLFFLSLGCFLLKIAIKKTSFHLIFFLSIA